jgi:hypothetical protein
MDRALWLDSNDHIVVALQSGSGSSEAAWCKLPSDGTLTGEYASGNFLYYAGKSTDAAGTLTEQAGGYTVASVSKASTESSVTRSSFTSYTETERASIEFLTRDIYTPRQAAGTIDYYTIDDPDILTEVTSYSPASVTGVYALVMHRGQQQIYCRGSLTGDDEITSIDASDPENMSTDDRFTNAAMENPRVIALDEGRDELFVIDSTGEEIHSINCATVTALALEDTLVIGANSNSKGLVIDDVNHDAYHVDTPADNIRSINTTTLTALTLQDSEPITDLLPSIAISIEHQHIFVGTSTAAPPSNCRSIDISTPTAIAVSDTLAITGMIYFEGMLVIGNVLFVAHYIDDSISAIDISDPTNMTLLDTLTDTTNLDAVQHIAAAPYNADYLYCTGTNKSFITIVDITDTSNLSVVSKKTTTNATGDSILVDTRG